MELDTLTKNFAKDPFTFAELFNTFIFNGKPIIKPENLSQRDVTELIDSKERKILLQKSRDLIKHARVMADDQRYYMLLGIENQSQIDHVMPMRSLLYDALNYESQIRTYEKELKQKIKDKKIIGGNPMERFKGFKPLPVITMTLYWGKDQWIAPKSLKDMFPSSLIEAFGNIINDYDIHLYSVYDLEKMKDEDIRKLSSNLKDLVIIMSRAEKEDGFEHLPEDFYASLQSVDYTTAHLAKVLTGSLLLDLPEEDEKKEERINVCRAMEDLINHNQEKGEERGIVKVLNILVKEGDLPVETAARHAGMSEEEFKKQYESYLFS